MKTKQTIFNGLHNQALNSHLSEKKWISHLSALGARPRMDSGGFWDEGRTARLAGISRTCQALLLLRIALALAEELIYQQMD